MEFAIYQIRKTHDTDFLKWMPLSSFPVPFPVHIYDKVYSDRPTAFYPDSHRQLESIYREFNISHPDDFRGHSLSVSDVVGLSYDEGQWTYYFCDRYGWEQIDFKP